MLVKGEASFLLSLFGKIKWVYLQIISLLFKVGIAYVLIALIRTVVKSCFVFNNCFLENDAILGEVLHRVIIVTDLKVGEVHSFCWNKLRDSNRWGCLKFFIVYRTFRWENS